MDNVPEQISWRAIASMIRHSQPADARYSVLLAVGQKAKAVSVSESIKETIAVAKWMGWA